LMDDVGRSDERPFVVGGLVAWQRLPWPGDGGGATGDGATYIASLLTSLGLLPRGFSTLTYT
jgi:hypothetical protein